MVGSDPIFHHETHPGGTTLTNDVISFVTSTPGETGAYICLSCTGTAGPVPFLDPFGGTWATYPTDCGSNVTICKLLLYSLLVWDPWLPFVCPEIEGGSDVLLVVSLVN